MSAELGARIILSDQGEGWFPEYKGRSVHGTVRQRFGPQTGDNPYYLITFDEPLELQERGASTVSGLTLVRYDHAVIRCRWVAHDIGFDGPVSVHVHLIPHGALLPLGPGDIQQFPLRIWAECRMAGPEQ